MSNKFIKVFLLLIYIVCLQFAPKFALSGDVLFLRNGAIALDLLNKREWLRCSIGQEWIDGDCKGEVLKLSIVLAEKVAIILKSRFGPGWRLPTLDELTSLVEKDQTPPKINKKIFPNTYKGPYWTSNENKLTKDNNWSVNFFTGQNYGRFFRNQQLAVRLVRIKQ